MTTEVCVTSSFVWNTVVCGLISRPLDFIIGSCSLKVILLFLLSYVFPSFYSSFVFLYSRKRKESEPRTKCLLNNADITPHHPTDPVEMRRINFQTPGTGRTHNTYTEGQIVLSVKLNNKCSQTNITYKQYVWLYLSTLVFQLKKRRKKNHFCWQCERCEEGSVLIQLKRWQPAKPAKGSALHDPKQ